MKKLIGKLVSHTWIPAVSFAALLLFSMIVGAVVVFVPSYIVKLPAPLVMALGAVSVIAFLGSLVICLLSILFPFVLAFFGYTKQAGKAFVALLLALLFAAVTFPLLAPLLFSVGVLVGGAE